MTDQRLRYHELHRAGRPGWWRGPLGTVLLAVSLFAVMPVVWMIPFVVGFAATGGDVLADLAALTNLTDPTPLGLAYLNLVLASAIPITWLLSRLLHGLRPGWLTSVLPRMRWRFFVQCLGLAVLALLATVLVAVVLPADSTGAELGGTPNAWTPTLRDFLLVVVLLTPLQAAGEEYAFRGYLTQVFGRFGWLPAIVAPAVLFAFAHGIGQSLPIFFDRLAFGLVAGVLVVLTGGLEAAIAMHVLNNFLAFGLALVFSDMATALNPTGGDWWSIPVTLTQSLVYLGLALAVAHRTGLEATTAEPVLVASRRRV